MDQLTSLRVLHTVVEAGSFVAAAQRLKLSTASVTRHIAALEQHLGTRLLHRTTRSLSLSEAGRLYLERTRPLLDELGAVDQAVRARNLSPSGVLRINAPVSFGLRHLAAPLAVFRDYAPDLQLDIDLNDRVVDLAQEGYDVALRIGHLSTSNLVARPVTYSRLVLCAAPSYLERHGTPSHPQQLREHQCLIYTYMSHRRQWTFTQRPQTTVDESATVTAPGGVEQARTRVTETVRIQGAVTANNGDLLSAMAAADCGIAFQPGFIVHQALRERRLVPILPRWQAPRLELHAVYLHRHHLSAKVRSFIDFLADYWDDPPPWEQWS